MRCSVADTVFDRLHARLQHAGIAFTVLRHEPVFTSEQAAAVRGTSLASGAKALVTKAGERFLLLVLPADRKLDSRKAREALGVKSLRFATRQALAENPSINFNAGDHAISIQMGYADYEAFEKPRLLAIAT
jgi:Ala-tRNA(Pro) deacylase